MSGSGLQKYFEDVAGLRAHPFFDRTGLRQDVKDGQVFPAIRKNEAHFYYGGARLCVYKGGAMFTNNRYLNIQDDGKSRDVRIGEDRFTSDAYQTIKDRCRQWRPADSELSVVGALFPAYSIAASSLSGNPAWLLDIECRFPGGANSTDANSKAQDMIDCLFLTREGTLVFIEVKRTDNAEARGSGQGEPAVASQLRRYRRQLESDELRKEIKQVYAEVIRVLGQILGAELPGPPRKLLPTVPLLVVGEADAPSPRAKEVWQRDLLAAPAALDAEIIGIDGRNSRVAAALDDFFARLASESAGAARP